MPRYRELRHTPYASNSHTCRRYPIIARPSPSAIQHFESNCARDYGHDYAELRWLWMELPNIVAPGQDDVDCESPIIDGNFAAAQYVAEPLPFAVVKEFLLRLHLEFASFGVTLAKGVPGYATMFWHTLRAVSVPVQRDPLLQKRVAAFLHWCGRGRPRNDAWTDWFEVERSRTEEIRRSAYLRWCGRGKPARDDWADWFAAEASYDRHEIPVFIGSPEFWRWLEHIESLGISALSEALAYVCASPSEGLALYACWKADSYDKFFEQLLFLGLRQGACARSERVILHLSDLHIGLTGMADRAESLVSKIADVYHAYVPKPIVMLTGDIVDEASQQNLEKAASLLRRLRDAGFVVLPLPGNHEYSNATSKEDMLPLQHLYPPIDIIVGAVVLAKGGDMNHITGMTLSGDAVSRCHQILLGPALPGWTPGETYLYKEEFWRECGAKALQCVLIDAQDLGTKVPLWALPFLAREELFMHDGEVRLAHGYVHPAELLEINSAVLETDPDAVKVVGIHYWLNYWARTPLKHERCELAMLVIPLVDKKTPAADTPSFLEALFRSAIRLALLPADDLRQFVDAAADFSFRPGFHYQAAAHEYGWDEPYGAEYCSNPTYSVDETEQAVLGGPNNSLVNQEALFPALDRSHLLLVGHRHISPSQVQVLSGAVAESVREKQAKMYAAELTRTRITELEIRAYLAELPTFKHEYSLRIETLKSAFLDAVSKVVSQTSLRVDLYNELEQMTLKCICESSASTETRTWVELRVNLIDGATYGHLRFE